MTPLLHFTNSGQEHACFLTVAFPVPKTLPRSQMCLKKRREKKKKKKKKLKKKEEETMLNTASISPILK